MSWRDLGLEREFMTRSGVDVMHPQWIAYSAGFLFNQARDLVVLIKKNRPAWQAGRFSAVGGKIEITDSSPHEAMVREFQEETGLLIPAWRPAIHYTNPARGGTVFIFDAVGEVYDIKKTTDEEPCVVPISQALTQLDVLDNLKWMLPLLASRQVDTPFRLVEDVEYTKQRILHERTHAGTGISGP